MLIRIMLFRRDLVEFDELGYGNWDGFQRINTETKSGGIIGVFKQAAITDEWQVLVKYLDEQNNYVVKHAPSGEIVAQGTGEELATKGFKVVFEDEFQGELYEVTEIK